MRHCAAAPEAPHLIRQRGIPQGVLGDNAVGKQLVQHVPPNLQGIRTRRNHREVHRRGIRDLLVGERRVLRARRSRDATVKKDGDLPASDKHVSDAVGREGCPDDVGRCRGMLRPPAAYLQLVLGKGAQAAN